MRERRHRALSWLLPLFDFQPRPSCTERGATLRAYIRRHIIAPLGPSGRENARRRNVFRPMKPRNDWSALSCNARILRASPTTACPGGVAERPIVLPPLGTGACDEPHRFVVFRALSLPRAWPDTPPLSARPPFDEYQLLASLKAAADRVTAIGKCPPRTLKKVTLQPASKCVCRHHKWFGIQTVPSGRSEKRMYSRLEPAWKHGRRLCTRTSWNGGLNSSCSVMQVERQRSTE